MTVKMCHDDNAVKPFTSAGDFRHRLAILDDKRLYPMADAIRDCRTAYAKPDGNRFGLLLLADMRRTGLLDDTMHLTQIGVELWNRFHS